MLLTCLEYPLEYLLLQSFPFIKSTSQCPDSFYVLRMSKSLIRTLSTSLSTPMAKWFLLVSLSSDIARRVEGLILAWVKTCVILKYLFQISLLCIRNLIFVNTNTTQGYYSLLQEPFLICMYINKSLFFSSQKTFYIMTNIIHLNVSVLECVLPICCNHCCSVTQIQLKGFGGNSHPDYL